MSSAQGFVGRTIDGRYEVTGALGEGGMGVVLRARHTFTGADVALKLLHPHLGVRDDIARRFLAEARAPQAIRHPGLVPVTDAGVTPEGAVYLAMELLHGETLAARMHREALPFEEIRRVGREVLAVLAAAHAAGFVHRDLKPENLFLARPSAAVRVLDFGIAKVMSEQGAATATGALMGTLAYMSPEQLRDTSKVDHRTDLWSFAVVLYEMSAGALPHVAPSFGEMLIRLLSVPAPPIAEHLAGAPPELDAFFQRALAVRIEDRFATAIDMDRALAALPPAELSRRRGAAAMAPTALSAQPSSANAAPSRGSPSHLSFSYGAPTAPVTSIAGAHAPAAPPAPAASGAGFSAPPSPIGAPPISPIAQMTAAAPPAWAMSAPQSQSRAPEAAHTASPPASPGGRPWWLLASVGVFALVVLAAAGIIAALSLRPGASGEKPPSSASSAPAIEAPPGPDPACARACGKLQACGVPLDAGCANGCTLSAPMRQCLAGLASSGRDGDCEDLAACAVGASCPRGPSGRASCRATGQCEAACSTRKINEAECICDCIGRLDPEKSLELLTNNACAVTRCPKQCNPQTPFSACLDCFVRSCAREGQACSAN